MFFFSKKKYTGDNAMDVEDGDVLSFGSDLWPKSYISYNETLNLSNISNDKLSLDLNDEKVLSQPKSDESHKQVHLKSMVAHYYGKGKTKQNNDNQGK